MSILDDFKARFPPPAFQNEIVDEFLPPLIEIYTCYNGWDYESKCGKEVILNLLAHLLTGASNADPTPSITLSNVSVGDVSMGYLAPTSKSNNFDFFGTTKYGRTYLQLISSNIGGLFV